MNSLVNSIANWLADYYLLSGVLLMLTLLAMATIRQPAQRRAITQSTLCALFLLAVLCALPGWSTISLINDQGTAITSEQISESTGITPKDDSENLLPTDQRTTISRPLAGVSALPQVERRRATLTWPDVSWPTVAVIVWISGAIGMLLWLAIGSLAARRLRRMAQPAPPELLDLMAEVIQLKGGIFHPTDLLLSDRTNVAVALGFWRPAVLLPAHWATQSPLPFREGLGEVSLRDQLRSVLAHEWAHIRNHDVRWLAASRALLVLLWAQPLYWLLRRWMRLDQEALADAAAAKLTSRERYAEQLVAWARNVATQPAVRLSSAVGLWESASQIRRRIALLVDERLTVLHRCSKSWIAAVAAALIGIATGLSLLTLQPATHAAENTRAVYSKESSGESLEYTGTVVDRHSEKPIAGATVVVRRQTSSKHPWPTLAETKHITDADGTYKFTIPPAQLNDKKLYIELDVTHSDYAPRTGFGYALSMIRKNERLGGRPFFERVELEPAKQITGVAKTPDGGAAAGIPVLAFSKAKPKDLSEYGSWSRGKTDGEGRFELNVTDGGHAVLWLLPEKYTQQTHVLNDKRGDLGVFALKDGIRLKGQVLDRNGKPISGVWANAELMEGPAKQPIDMPVADQIDRSALTDADGQFELAPLPPGTYRVLPEESPEENPNRDREPRPLSAAFLPQRIELTEGEMPEPIIIKAADTVTIEAQIYDSAGKPRSGHGVDFWGRTSDKRGDYFYATERPNAEGHFKFEVPKGMSEAKLTFSTNEHQALRYRLAPGEPLRAERELDFGTIDRDYGPIEIYYYTAPLLIVGARNEAGKPIPDFKPSIVYDAEVKTKEEASRWISGVEGEVNFEKQEDGRWRTEQMLPDEKIKLTVSADGYKSVKRELALPEGAVEELTVTLFPDAVNGNDKGANDTTRRIRALPVMQQVPSSKGAGDRPPALLSYGDGKADGKKSYGGSGHLIQFEMPNGVTKARGLQIHGSRYGYPQAPKEDFEITFLGEDGEEVLHSEAAPYHLFKRGKETWVRVMFDKEVELPEKFWVALNFNAEQTKGVYMSYDTSTKGEHSRVGLPGDDEKPKETDFGGDWMVQVRLARPR